ncbi:MAG: hypothetical protein K0S20_140 [Patescibacteria group bacterium]|jgi:DNA-binding XRE family transcriptional regulator|nr:hypothetical protein [Patescibacteria group bacterium]
MEKEVIHLKKSKVKEGGRTYGLMFLEARGNRSQKWSAEVVGISQSTVSKIESEDIFPSYELSSALCAKLDIDLQKFWHSVEVARLQKKQQELSQTDLSFHPPEVESLAAEKTSDTNLPIILFRKEFNPEEMVVVIRLKASDPQTEERMKLLISDKGYRCYAVLLVNEVKDGKQSQDILYILASNHVSV